MANLYDTPAQAQFINTYVPIQFDSMYKMADKASADMERGNQVLDKLYEYESLGSMSDQANREWTENIWTPVKTYISENIKDVHDLSRPDVISGLRNLQRRLSGSQEARILLESKDAYKQTAAKVDPKWGSHYREKISNHSPLSQGIWSENPLEYADWNSVGDALTKDLGQRKLGTTNGGLTEVWGIATEDIQGAIADNANAIVSDPGNIETAKAQLSRLGIREGMDVSVKNGDKESVIPYDDYLRSYILESVSASAMDKANQRVEKTNDIAMESYRAANAWARMKYAEGKKDERAANQAKGVVGSITKEWHDRAVTNMAEKRISAINSKVESFRIKAQKAAGGKLKDSELSSMVKKEFGSTIYGYWESTRKSRWINNAIKNAENRLAEAAMNNDADATKKAKDEIQSLNESLNVEKARREYIQPAMINEIESNSSKLLSKQELVAFDQYDVPQDLSSTWSEINIGAPVILRNSRNTNHQMYQVGNPGSFRYASPLYGNQAHEAGLNSAIVKFNDGLINARGSGSMFFESSNKAFLDGDGSSMAGYVTVPESVLKESFAMSDYDIKMIKKSAGASSFKGRPMVMPKEDSTAFDDKGDPIIGVSDKDVPKDVPMVRIPVSTKFVGHNDGAVQEKIVDAEYNRRYKQNKLGVGDLEPMDY